MCVRTKTSYDCGCVFKTTNKCDVYNCTDLDRYHYMRDGDCQQCKSAGTEGTRGREGKGRYAQQMKRTRTKNCSQRVEANTSPNPSSNNVSPISIAGTLPTIPDVSRGASPWISARGKEKPWESPHRKQADDAWLSEHGDRLSDLQERFETCSLSQQAESKTPSRRYVYEPEEDNHNDNEQIHVKEVNFLSEKPPQTETRKRIAGDPSRRSHSDSSHRREDRQYSDESLPDSMPSYRSSPLLNSYNGVQHTYPERPHDHDFYRSTYSPSKPSTERYSSGSKTEPFVYNRSPYGYDDYVPPVDTFYSPKHYKGPSRQYDVSDPGGHNYVRYRPIY